VPGAGSAHLSFVKESSFGTEPGTPTYYKPGRNPTVETLTLDNLLTRLRETGTPEPVTSIVGNLDGAFSASWIVSEDIHGDVRDIVFNDGGIGFTTGLAATSSWYVGTKYLNTSDTENTVERNLTGVIPFSFRIDWTQGEPIRATFTGGYADESRNTSKTPSGETAPSDGQDVNFAGADWQVDGTTISRLDSASLEFGGPLYRYIRDDTRTADTAILATPETTLTVAATYHTNDQLEIAYGGATGNSSPQSTLSEVSGTTDLKLDSGGSTFVTYDLKNVVPRTYEWQDVISGDTDLTDPVTFDAALNSIS